MKLKNLGTNGYFNLAQYVADKLSGCQKVAVGSVIVKDDTVVSMGANSCLPDLCSCTGCLRVTKYGDDSKSHRDPADCRAIHSEVYAIASAARAGISLDGASIYVTRYPCESCAKAIVTAGIKTVYYGGTAEASEQTKCMLDLYGVNLYRMNWDCGDSNDR